MRCKRAKISVLAMKLISLLCVSAFSFRAQIKLDTSKKVNKLVLPVVFKTPEMGYALGISGSLTFKTTHHGDTTIRTSIIQGIGFLTTRKQNIQAIDAAIYFPKEKYIFLCQLAHTYFPDRFWGIGPSIPDRPMESYVYEQVYAGPHLKKKVSKHLFLGVLYEYQNLYRILYNSGGLFDNSDFSGKHPYQVSGFGVSISYDTRNSAFWPSKGTYLLSQFTDFRKQFLSSYDLYKWITDIRYFKKITRGQIVAIQFYNYETYGNAIPLKELAAFGGPNNMRGFYQGRFRADKMFSFITEYRIHLFGRFSSCFFGGFGDVYNKSSELSSANIKYSYGGGLRFAVLEKEKLNIRLDYGYNNRYNRGIYITFGECF